MRDAAQRQAAQRIRAWFLAYRPSDPFQKRAPLLVREDFDVVLAALKAYGEEQEGE